MNTYYILITDKARDSLAGVKADNLPQAFEKIGLPEPVTCIVADLGDSAFAVEVVPT